MQERLKLFYENKTQQFANCSYGTQIGSLEQQKSGDTVPLNRKQDEKIELIFLFILFIFVLLSEGNDA